jgi:hypothetical protein
MEEHIQITMNNKRKRKGDQVDMEQLRHNYGLHREA